MYDQSTTPTVVRSVDLQAAAALDENQASEYCVRTGAISQSWLTVLTIDFIRSCYPAVVARMRLGCWAVTPMVFENDIIIITILCFRAKHPKFFERSFSVRMKYLKIEPKRSK